MKLPKINLNINIKDIYVKFQPSMDPPWQNS